MKVVLFVFLGLLLGAIAGGTLGVVAGLIWTEVFNTTNREGQAGMLVFFGFMPIGIVVGAIGAPSGAAQKPRNARSAFNFALRQWLLLVFAE